MSLKDRLLSHGLSVSAVAQAAGTPTAHLYNLLNRVRRPRPELAMRIEAATNGLIPAWELLGLDPPAHQPSVDVAS
jgi:transcriptional regulator with XRE-family HTH domain